MLVAGTAHIEKHWWALPDSNGDLRPLSIPLPLSNPHWAKSRLLSSIVWLSNSQSKAKLCLPCPREKTRKLVPKSSNLNVPCGCSYGMLSPLSYAFSIGILRVIPTSTSSSLRHLNQTKLIHPSVLSTLSAAKLESRVYKASRRSYQHKRRQFKNCIRKNLVYASSVLLIPWFKITIFLFANFGPSYTRRLIMAMVTLPRPILLV